MRTREEKILGIVNTIGELLLSDPDTTVVSNFEKYLTANICKVHYTELQDYEKLTKFTTFLMRPEMKFIQKNYDQHVIEYKKKKLS